MSEDRKRRIAAWRTEYANRGLRREDLGTDPMEAFRTWFSEAETADLYEPNAMVVSTVGADGPASRLVLLKGVDERGFVFYTNYASRKATELAATPACSLLFPWHPLERQVRVEGVASRVSAAESDAYFATRPRAAQIGAWSSPQSEVVPSRDVLEARYVAEEDRFSDSQQVPRPDHWGGIVVRPHRVEFWQGRPGRMHDRLRFDRSDASGWSVVRLAP